MYRKRVTKKNEDGARQDPTLKLGIAESLTGQFHKRVSEQFDLMIEGKSLDELKKYRSELISRGIAAGEIPDESVFGHYLFCIKDPDGNGITIYTSHAN
jgi:hypothetical protein